MRENNPLQQTGAFWNSRIGKLTASRMASAMSYLKGGGDSAARKDLKIEILAERLTDNIVPKFVNGAMQWGIDHESMAKEAFEAKTGLKITDVGFVDHPMIEYFGASPDGFVSDGRAIEIKCPTTSTHLKYLLGGVIPDEYKPQMSVQSACTGKAVWFASFDPRMPKGKQLFIRLYEPTADEIKNVEAEAVKFLDEVEQMFEQLTTEEV
jgi:predicted phage-related endonuclease